VKKIIGLTIAALVVIGLVGSGTLALFSDVETSEDNTFTAGTLNLKVGDDDPTAVSISIPNLKPTDTGSAAIWVTKNSGSISGILDVAIGSVTNNENTLTEPESDASDGSGGALEGELGSFLKVAIWLDVDESGDWNTGDIALQSGGSTLTHTGTESLPYDYLDNYGGDSHTSLITMTADDAGLHGTDEFQFMVDYDFPTSVTPDDDQAQSDSAVFDVTFTLNQA